MSIYNDAKERLKDIYEYCKEKEKWEFAVSRDRFLSMTSGERNTMKMHFKIMEEEGWIEKYAPSLGTPYSFKLTTSGIKCAENFVEKPVVQTTNYHVTNANNSIIGNNPHNNTINVGISFEELISLVNQQFLEINERRELLDILNNLQEKINSSQPLEKGLLSKINSKLENCSWLSSGIASQVIQYLASTK